MIRLFLSVVWVMAGAIVQVNAQQNYFSANGKKIDVKELNEETVRMMDSTGVPGVSFAVIENGQVVFYNAYGEKGRISGGKVNKRTLFEACSLSKSFLVYVAHQLVDEGRLDLDKPIWQYLPNPRLHHDPRYKLITSRMILGHCSGIENWQDEHDPDTLEIMAPPGEKFVYSGEGYNYLANAISLILHQSYDEYITERIIRPLQLRRTFTKFKKNKIPLFRKMTPGNYARGHSSFGEEFTKWINTGPVPSSGYNLTAKDYADLIVFTFNGTGLSEKSKKDISRPLVRMNMLDSSMFLGEGFAVIYTKDDTIISQNGNNRGFKGALFYSIAHKRGFVYFSNGDRGGYLAGRLNEMTVGLNLDHFFESDDGRQYPSTATDLLKVYRDKNGEAMLTEANRLKAEGRISRYTLNDLADEFLDYNEEVAIQLLRMDIALNPGSSTAHRLMGKFYMNKNQYDSALVSFEIASKLTPDPGEIAYDLKDCKERLKTIDIEKRRSVLVAVSEHGNTVVQAEDYGAMFGIATRETNDTGGGYCVRKISTGHWMDYKVTIPVSGSYEINVRVASVPGHARLELREGPTRLATIHIPSTKGWENWTTLTTKINLPAGSQVLRVYVAYGEFDFNWFQFSKIADSSKS